MPTFTRPGPTAHQLSVQGDDSRWMLSVLTKRTYRVGKDGRLSVAEEQVPLTVEPVDDPVRPKLLLADSDLYPIKRRTDLVVLGHTYGDGRRQYEANVSVQGQVVKRILVVGERVCAAGSGGEIFISQSEPVEKLELTYARAYGGASALPMAALSEEAREKLKSLAVALERDVADLVKYEYPRNPAGCGFLIDPTPEAVAALALPNFEDPLQPLTAANLAVRDADHWPAMPLPQSTGWFGMDWFPRLAYLGIPPLARPPKEPVQEVVRGYAPANLFDNKNRPTDGFAFAQGASLGMQFAHLLGDETIVVGAMHPTSAEYAIRLPKDRPRIWTDGRKGTLKEAEPVIHTVVIEPDRDRVTVVWRGAAPSLRPYLPHELEKMPFQVEWGG